jgi:RNA polymerase-binding transcription factor DksA
LANVEPLFGRPQFDIPDLPPDLTGVDDRLMMSLFSEFVQWQNYAAYQFAEAEVAEERAEANVKRMEAEHMVLNWGAAKDKVTLSRAQQAVDPAIDRAKQELLVAYANRKLSSVIYGNCERCAQLISRELSRRLGRDPVERRTNRWSP